MPPVMRFLEREEIINAVDHLNEIYPHIPSLIFWRALEYAVYSRYNLIEPVLDLACGDGEFFHLVWGNLDSVIGIDIDPQTCERARASGVYSEVHQVSAHSLPFTDGSFASVFSNCALEHMDNIDQVLSETFRVIHDGGLFVASVVTDKLVEWEMLPLLASKLVNDAWGRKLKGDYENFHHLQNPFSIEEWMGRVEKAGFVVKESYPIAPEPFARVFMLLDELWHVKRGETEIGQDLYAYFSHLPDFSDGMKDIVRGLLKLSPAPYSGAGLVFIAEKKKP